jgi:hypothetical protein
VAGTGWELPQKDDRVFGAVLCLVLLQSHDVPWICTRWLPALRCSLSSAFAGVRELADVWMASLYQQYLNRLTWLVMAVHHFSGLNALCECANALCECANAAVFKHTGHTNSKRHRLLRHGKASC